MSLKRKYKKSILDTMDLRCFQDMQVEISRKQVNMCIELKDEEWVGGIQPVQHINNK